MEAERHSTLSRRCHSKRCAISAALQDLSSFSIIDKTLQMENISNFLEACKAYGVAEISCFQTVDLYENKQCYKVIECLRSLAAVVTAFHDSFNF